MRKPRTTTALTLPCYGPADLFTMYTFDESGEISVDEMTLALRSAAVGLAKLTDDVPPAEADIEAIAHDVRHRGL